tara:strand:+ start:932 stop:1540 length:609 start_codon:yes stop_codon:yes gene_type:complete
MDDQITASTRHVLYAVRVIVERQPLDNPWISHKWAVHDLIPLDISAGLGALPSGDIILQPLHADSSELDLYMADIRIDLHHAEAEAYAENLQSSDPAIYVVLRRTEDVDTDEEEDSKNGQSCADVRLFDVSLSPYNIQDYEDCGEDQIEKLPLQGPIAQFVEAFVDQHFTPEVFVKRKRDKARIDADTQRGGDARLARRRTH